MAMMGLIHRANGDGERAMTDFVGTTETAYLVSICYVPPAPGSYSHGCERGRVAFNRHREQSVIACRPGGALARLGLSSDAVDWVALTHRHLITPVAR